MNQEAVKAACADGMTPECIAQTKLAFLGIDSYSGYAEYNTYYNLLEQYPEQMAQYGEIIDSYTRELIRLIDSGYTPAEAESYLNQQFANNQKYQEAINNLPTWAAIAMTIQDMIGDVYGANAAGTSLSKLAGESKSLNALDIKQPPNANMNNYTYAEAVIKTGNSGKLVNADKAVIDPNKITSYALNTEHPVGGNKASALGYNQSNANELISKIQEGAKTNTAVLNKADNHGQRITIDMPITGANGKTAIVRTGWIYDPGSSIPRLTTLYVK